LSSITRKSALPSSSPRLKSMPRLANQVVDWFALFYLFPFLRSRLTISWLDRAISRQ
jgi:hypothetical protein